MWAQDEKGESDAQEECKPGLPRWLTSKRGRGSLLSPSTDEKWKSMLIHGLQPFLEAPLWSHKMDLIDLCSRHTYTNVLDNARSRLTFHWQAPAEAHRAVCQFPGSINSSHSCNFRIYVPAFTV